MTVIQQIQECIESSQSFVLEAGAGSGKTYSLIETINYLLQEKGSELEYNGQRIVCITYTNVAKNEIKERLENNDLVVVATIHEFLWDTVKSYPRQLLIELDKLNEIRYKEELAKKAELKGKKLETYKDKYQPNLIERVGEIEVEYNETSYRKFDEGILHHDDVITLAKMMLSEYSVLADIFVDKFPFLLVDEYQDTAIETVDAFLNNLISSERKKQLVIGFFGDSHQKIYDAGVGNLTEFICEGAALKLITKEENYRSSKAVIDFLNKIRDNIQQKVPAEKSDTILQGSVRFIDAQSGGENKIENYNTVVRFLENEGWDFSDPKKSKILMLANRGIAEISGYGNLYNCYSSWSSLNAGSYLFDKEDRYVRFFIGSIDKKLSIHRENGIEHLLSFFERKEYNEVMNFLRLYGYENSDTNEHFNLKTHSDKARISDRLYGLEKIAKSGKVKDVLNYIRNEKLIKTPENIQRFETKLKTDIETLEDEEEKDRLKKDIDFYNNLMELDYSEFRNLNDYTENHTPFSTKHGTKGEEYDNVLFVIDDDHRWYKYKGFNEVVARTYSKFSEEKKELLNNLFYVSCSRAKNNLVILALSDMSIGINNLTQWLGKENMIEINNL